MKLLTYNAGLLDFRVFGKTLIKPADFVEERFEALASSIQEFDADVVALQEIYEPRHKQLLASRLSETYPHAGMSPLRGPRVVPASLLTLSKWPITDQRFVRFEHMPLAERLIDSKGFLLSMIETPRGPLLVANVHTTAGGTRHPEDPRTDRIRAQQIAQLCRATEVDRPVLLAGDFNCGSVSRPNYDQVLDAGYTDVWTRLCTGDDGFTWDPESILNADGTHTQWGCPAQRIDLILLNRHAMGAFAPCDVRRVFLDHRVRVHGSAPVTLSDHFGILAGLGEPA